MQLTLYTDYSFRVLIYLSIHKDERVSIEEIAQYYNISKDHLIKVVNHLGKEGFIKTIRGRKGGIEMCKNPQQVKVGDIVRAMEPTLNLVECFDPKTNKCAVTPSCNLKNILFKANKAFMNELDQYTLDDMITKKETNVVFIH